MQMKHEGKDTGASWLEKLIVDSFIILITSTKFIITQFMRCKLIFIIFVSF